MSNRPHLSYLNLLRGLKGEPRVTFPEGDASYPMTERVKTELKADAILAFGTPEPDATRFPNNVLTYQEETESDGHMCEMYRRYEVLPGPALIRQVTDDETMTAATIVTQRIATPSFPIAMTEGVDYTFDPVTMQWGRATSALLYDAVSITRTVTNTVDFFFPRLILGATAQAVSPREGDARTRILWTGAGGVPARNGFNAQTKMTTVVTYHLTQAAAETAAAAAPVEYAPIFNDLFYDGLFWNANERGVLNDAVTIPSYTTGTNNPNWGYVVEPAVVFAASTPTATAYIALANGTPRVISHVITPWRYNLWRLETKKVVLR